MEELITFIVRQLVDRPDALEALRSMRAVYLDAGRDDDALMACAIVRVVAERENPRTSFSGHTLQSPWDPLDRAYFNGYANGIVSGQAFVARYHEQPSRE